MANSHNLNKNNMENNELIKHLQNTIDNQRLIIDGLRKESANNALASAIFTALALLVLFTVYALN